MNYAGLVGDKLNPLTGEQVERIHESGLKILQEVGIKVDSERYLQLLKENGANVALKERRARLPEGMVKEFVNMAPATVTLYGRMEEYDLKLQGRKAYFGTGGAAVNVLDLESRTQTRASTLEDQLKLAKLVEGLENVHFFQAPVVPTDVPEKDMSLNSFYASLRGTKKNVQESVTGPEKVKEIVEMASLVAGSQKALLERPFISFVTSWMVSPLKLDVGTTKVLEEITNYRIPVALSSAPVTGSTAPASLAGLLAQVHAEELSGIALSQIFQEGAPVLYGPVPAAANMKNMAYLAGAPETGMMNAAAVQLADYVDVPVYSDAGETDAKIPDTQAGIESAFNLVQLGLAGGNYIHHAAGMIESMLGVSYEKLVIDNDVIGMVMRAMRGIDVDEDSLALDVIKEVGPGNDFLTQAHTIEKSRSDEIYTPRVLDRENRSTWQAEGAQETRDRAKERARTILDNSKANLIPGDIDEKIRERYEIHLPKTIN